MPLFLPITVLTLQTAVPLLIRATRKHAAEGEGYSPASLTLVGEVLKMSIALICMVWHEGERHKEMTLRGSIIEATRRFSYAAKELR
jgi:hypothetical protein